MQLHAAVIPVQKQLIKSWVYPPDKTVNTS
jgi:hypothetical protein